MADGFIARLPDLSALLALGQRAESGLSGVSAGLEGSASGQPGSLLAPVAAALEGLRGKLNIDVSGLSQRFPGALTTIRNAVPAGTVEQVNALRGAYDAARGFVADTPLAREVAAHPSFQAAALAAVNTALEGFRARQTDLAGRLVDAELVTRLREGFDAMQRMRGNFPANQAEFLPFLSQNLLGLAPDVLRAPLDHVQGSFAVFARMEASALDAALGPARLAVETALRDLRAQVLAFDATDAAAYTGLAGLLQTLETGMTALGGVATTFYQGLQSAVDTHAWDQVFGRLESLLRGITLEAPFSVNDLVASLSAALNEILMRVQTVLGPDDVARRIDELGRTIRDTFVNSPLGQVRQALRDFLDRIRAAIESVPTEQVQQTVEQMLARVRQEVDGLGIEQIGTAIENALGEAETFLTQNINSALRDGVRDAVAGLLENLRNIPLGDLATALDGAMDQLRALIGELEQALAGAMAQVSDFLGQLEALSFQPVAEEVIGEIDEIKQRLAAMNPDAMSDIEKGALRAALAVLQSIDLEGKIIDGLKQAFAAAGQALRRLLDDLAAVMERLRQQVGAFQPAQLLESITQALTRAQSLAENLNGRLLLRPLYDQLDAATGAFAAVGPGQLLDPLQGPYQTMLGAVDQLNPAAWLAPLNDLYTAIDRLIAQVDITPVMEELDRRRRTWLNEARNSVLNALDNLNAPAPIPAFLATLRPFVEAMSDALFGDPAQGLQQMATNLRTQVKLSALLEPLDLAFDELLGLATAVPAAALTDAMNTLRTGLGVAVDVLDPGRILQRFRAGLAQISELEPRMLLPASLPALQAEFEARVAAAGTAALPGVAAVRLRFDASLRITAFADPQSVIARLQSRHEALHAALRARINSLGAREAEAAYSNLRRSLDRLLPDFLRSPVALTHQQIIAGLEGLRPSRQAAPLDGLVDEFLQKIEPLRASIETPTVNFFGALRDVLSLLDPLSLKDAVAAIYDTIRQKVRILDPVALAAQIRTTFFDPLRNVLTQLDPAVWKQRLNLAFQRVLAAITNNVRGILDDIVAAIDVQFRALRALLAQSVQTISVLVRTALAAVQDVLDRLENLVFVELLERLRHVLENLEASFGRELDRVRSAFDDMLAAIPLGGEPAASGAVSLSI